MKIHAVYRCLYGEDFVQASIRSIDEAVERIFVFWDDTAWGDCDHAIYKGERVDFPKPPATFDRVVERIKALNNPKVTLIYDHQKNNINQFTHFTNDILIPQYGKPDMYMVIEIDHVFRQDQLHQAVAQAERRVHSSTRQIEIWKGLQHRVPERVDRPGVIFWNMSGLNGLPYTGRQADAPGRVVLDAYVHNMGFAVSPHVMFWKHMTAIAFSSLINDSLPSQSWLEDKWMNWTPETRDLEISEGCGHHIPCVVPYPEPQLPPL